MQETQTIERLGNLVTLREVARQKGCTVNSVYLWVKTHDVPFSRLGKSILLSESKALEYIPRSKR